MDSIGEGTVISFVKPDSWGDKISAYVYDESLLKSLSTDHFPVSTFNTANLYV